MFESFSKLPVGHDLNSSKLRTKDVLLEETVKFSSLLLEEKIQNGLSKCGFTFLSPIQKNALPLALTGTSLIAHSKSGTGKTLVYLLTALNIYLKTKSNNLLSLILAPTREIAKQVYDVFKNVACFIEGLHVEYFIGGTPLDLDTIKCRNCHIAIGAPGRIKHLIELGELKVQELKLSVLDEVDMLLSHKEFAVLELLSLLPMSRQTIVCTATLSENIRELLKSVSPEIKYVTINDSSGNEDCASTSNILIGVKQYVAPVFHDSSPMDSIRKRSKLVEILQNFKYDQCFIFVNYISMVKSLCNFLASNNLPALWVSSEQNQSTRIATLNKLKMQECRILVTTDLAARGIDVHNVNLVINLGTPCPPEVYIHRMGRAGRYGSEGAVITIIHEGEEIEQFKRIVGAVSTDPVDLYVLPSEINSSVCDDQLQVIRCLPQPDPELQEEYLFRRNINPGQSSGPEKKKSKKNKKKKQPAQVVVAPAPVVDLKLPETVKDDVFDSDCLTDESKPPRISSSSENHVMEKMIHQYVETIKEQVNQKESLDASVLAKFFAPSEKPLKKIRFADYSRLPDLGEPIAKENSICQPDAAILSYVNAIRGKHSFLDEQKIPCSIAQFFELFDNDETVVTNHTPVGFTDFIKDILCKLRELAHAVITKQSHLVAIDTIGRGSKKSLKRTGGKYNLPDEVYRRTCDSKSEDTEDSCNILQETSNWVLGRMNPIHSPKRTRKDKPVEFDPGPVKMSTNPKYSASASGFVKPVPIAPDAGPATDVLRPGYESRAKVTSNESTYGRLSNNGVDSNVPSSPILQRNKDSKNARQGSAQQVPTNAGCVQCPNCQVRFTVSSSDQGEPLLLPLRAYVNADTERNIWQSHFNFISHHVRSLPSIFGNR